MKKISIIFAVYFLLVGCTSKVIITPDKLPDAVIGNYYYERIDISRGSGPISAVSFYYHITPENSGLEIIFPEINGVSEYNNIAVQGLPKLLEDITVRVKGAMIPVSLFGGSSEFDKTYIIKVKESK